MVRVKPDLLVLYKCGHHWRISNQQCRWEHALRGACSCSCFWVKGMMTSCLDLLGFYPVNCGDRTTKLGVNSKLMKCYLGHVRMPKPLHMIGWGLHHHLLLVWGREMGGGAGWLLRKVGARHVTPVQKKPHWTPGYCLCSWAISSLKCLTARAAK